MGSPPASRPRDLAKAHRVAAQLEAGITWVNGWALLDPSVPFGGVKASGWGREGGPEAMESYQRSHSIVFNLEQGAPSDRRPRRSARGAGELRRLRTSSSPIPAPGEVLVKLVASGLCHTDLGVIAGGIPFPTPGIIGHEGAGIVAAVGEGVTAVAVGDKVLLSFTSCGTCAACALRATPPTARPGCRAISSGCCVRTASADVTRDGRAVAAPLLRPVVVRPSTRSPTSARS